MPVRSSNHAVRRQSAESREKSHLSGLNRLWLQSTDMYTDDASVKDYNKGLKLLKAGYTIYLVYPIPVVSLHCFAQSAGKGTGLLTDDIICFAGSHWNI